MTSTWDTIAMPILRWCAESPTARYLNPGALELDVDDELIDLELRRLVDAGYLTGKRVNAPGLMMPRLTERGLRAAGVWPPEEVYEGLLNSIDSAIANATTDDERGRLRKLRDSVVGLGRDIGVNLLSGYIQSRAGL